MKKERQKKGSFYIPQYTGIREILRCGGFFPRRRSVHERWQFLLRVRAHTLFWGEGRRVEKTPLFYPTLFCGKLDDGARRKRRRRRRRPRW